ncbi:MAG: hypothetical protein WKF75_00075 [Singulisphaera sp.]
MGHEERAHAALVLRNLTSQPEPEGKAALKGESLARMFLAMKKLNLDLDDLL